MGINKQLFEDILAGKLKGTFVLRNGETYFSDSLHQNYNKFRKTHPYAINLWSYTSEGKYFEDVTSILDVVDFIPYIFVIDSEIYSYNKNDIEFIEHFINGHYMKENELTITIPEGQEINWEESAKQEKIVFKKRDTKPKSWEEYCKNFKGQYYYIQDNRDNIDTSFTPNGLISAYKNYVPSKELAEAFLAMMQLISLRQAWIGDWKPDWSNEYTDKYCIIGKNYCNFEIYTLSRCRYALSFPTREMAIDFMNCFKDLLNVARPLI